MHVTIDINIHLGSLEGLDVIVYLPRVCHEGLMFEHGLHKHTKRQHDSYLLLYSRIGTYSFCQTR